MFCVWHDGPFHKRLSTPQDPPCLAQGAFKLQRGRSAKESIHPDKPSTEVMAFVATTRCTSSLFADGPTAHWVGPETLTTRGRGGQD